MNNTTYKCAFKHCQHQSGDIPQTEAVRVGTRYMHVDCANVQSNISQVKDIYYKQISKTVVMKQLVNVINQLIFTKKIDSGFLLFAIKYALATKIPINSPYGLHYLVDNKKVRDAWEDKQARIILKEIKEETKEYQTEPRDVSFLYSQEQNSGFGKIIKGRT